jgi:hypothetical protein
MEITHTSDDIEFLIKKRDGLAKATKVELAAMRDRIHGHFERSNEYRKLVAKIAGLDEVLKELCAREEEISLTIHKSTRDGFKLEQLFRTAVDALRSHERHCWKCSFSLFVGCKLKQMLSANANKAGVQLNEFQLLDEQKMEPIFDESRKTDEQTRLLKVDVARLRLLLPNTPIEPDKLMCMIRQYSLLQHKFELDCAVMAQMTKEYA